MPKLHDLCQQFWEEITSAAPKGDTTRSPEEIVEIAYGYMQNNLPRDADVLKRHLLVLSRELNIQPLKYDEVEQLTESLFG